MQEFSETQYFRRNKISIFFSIFSAIILGLLVKSFFDEGNHNKASIIGISIMGSILLLFNLMKLECKITDQKIEYKYFPLHRKWRSIDRTEVANISFLKYSALGDYGGWGVRYGSKRWAYNVSGNYGIFVEFKSGKTVMLGTVKYKELCK